MSNTLKIKLLTSIVNEGVGHAYGETVELGEGHAVRMCLSEQAEPVGFDLADSRFDQYRSGDQVDADGSKDASAPVDAEPDSSDSMDADADPEPDELEGDLEDADGDLEDAEDAEAELIDERAVSSTEGDETAEG
jgi:hypothetical protein